jgi:RimJ/RimL family protein N-acetyltransferase
MRYSSTHAAPDLDTERLTLRGHAAADLADCAAMWADPAVARHTSGQPLSEEEVWSRVLRYAGLWTLVGLGYWVARDRTTGRLVGEVGLADFRRDLTPALGDAPEAGWVLAPWAHGRGLATEAVRAALAWGDAHLAAPRSVCLIAPANAPSLRVAEKCGFREYARTTYKRSETLVLERLGG